jgi:hypothetical protein
MEFPQLNQAGTVAGIATRIAAERARPMVMHNSRIVCWGMMGTAVCSLFIGVCMVLMMFSLLFPVSAITFMRVLAAAQWGLGGVMMCYMCPWLWKWSQGMLHKKVKLDERGVDFQLGTKKNPQELFMPWDIVASVQQKRVGTAQQFTIMGTDGSVAQFSSYTFFRPKRIAKLIAERVGQTIQKG